MSNPQTFYTTIDPNGYVLDLSNIFQPIGVAPPGPPTGYLTSISGVATDLSDLFAPNVGIFLSYDTGFEVNGTDLRYVFNAKLPDYSATGTFVVSSDGTYNTILTFTGAGTFTLNKSVVGGVNYIVVGGGGAGSYNNPLLYYGGAGGGGGQVLYGSVAPTLQTASSVTVGTGGVATFNSAQNGTSSTLTGTGFAGITSAGGGAGSTSFFLPRPGGTGGSVTNSGGNGDTVSANGGNGITVPGFTTYAGGGSACGGTGGSGGGGTSNINSVGGNGTFYGAGGGGAGLSNTIQNPGGSGANGVVILYFNV